jgi:epoxyqueuosine reductase
MEAKAILDFAKAKGADVVAVAPVDRFAGAPQGHRPEDLLPGGRSVAAMAKRIPRAIVKKIPGPYYEKFGYHDLNAHLRELAYHVAVFFEDQGYEAFPLDPSIADQARRVEIIQEQPEPKIKIYGDFSHRHAIVAAGLGEIAASSVGGSGTSSPAVRQTCGICLRVCPIGLTL